MSRPGLMSMQASNYGLRPQYQPAQQPQPQPQHVQPKSLQKTRAEQVKDEQAAERRDMKEEILKLAALTKPKLRAYFQEQIDEKSEE